MNVNECVQVSKKIKTPYPIWIREKINIKECSRIIINV